jgi:heat shock protein HslJ
MNVSRAFATLLLASPLHALPAAAAEPRLVCFGNEPSWSLRFDGAGRATLAFPDGKPVEYRGRETRLDFLKERAWRGTPAGDKTAVVVALLREAPCSDTMSDTAHPVSARVSLPDGRLLAGCCRIPALSFEGTTWRLTSTGGPAADSKEVRPSAPTVRFADGRASGFSGCNRFTGGFKREGDTLTVGPLGGTMMACPEPRMAIEKSFLDGLSGTHRVAISGDRLTLTPASGAPLVFQAEPEPTLEGVTWKVTGFNNGRSAVVSAVTGTSLTLTFENGVVRGSSGCNTFRAPYTSEGNHLSIGAAATTRKACGAEGVMEQERKFLAALKTALVWTVESGTLDVHRADGERVLNATAASGSTP